jgi:uncharacterized protein (DUF4213/DUF364 family)
MQLNQRLYDLFAAKAAEVSVETLSIGLGYTAVTTSDGGIGLACTYFESHKPCSLNEPYRDYEGRPALELIDYIHRGDMVRRSMALAAINALNHDHAIQLPEDRDNSVLFEQLDIHQGTRVAMVGLFEPMLKLFQRQGAALEIIDASRAMGQKQEFYEKLGNWAEALILTSTSIINNTIEEVLAHTNKKLKTVLLGPSTPMKAEAFEHLPVHLLAGMVPIEKENILKAIRHGSGTPVLKKFSRKSYLVIQRSTLLHQ